MEIFRDGVNSTQHEKRISMTVRKNSLQRNFQNSAKGEYICAELLIAVLEVSECGVF